MEEDLKILKVEYLRVVCLKMLRPKDVIRSLDIFKHTTYILFKQNHKVGQKQMDR